MTSPLHHHHHPGPVQAHHPELRVCFVSDKQDVKTNNMKCTTPFQCLCFLCSLHIYVKPTHYVCAIDFQTESVLARNKKLKGYWNYQFFISYQLTFDLKVHCTWSGLIKLVLIFVNAKILILSYKISIFAFTKIVLEQKYLEILTFSDTHIIKFG